MKLNHLYYVVFILFLASSCSNTKYLADGELLYVGGKVKVEGKEISNKERKKLRKESENLLRPKPNKKLLGLRHRLFFYNLAGKPKKEKGFRHWLRTKVGEPPVLFSISDLDYNKNVLQNHAENKGFFYATTSADSTRKKKKVKALYTIKPGQQYKIKQVIFPTDSTELNKIVTATQDKSFLKAGESYDLDKIKAERIRIDAYLKEQGYFYFNPDFLKVQVDSTVGNHQVDLLVKVKGETPFAARNVYRINNIIIYPNYSLSRHRNKNADSITIHNDFKIIDPEHLFNPRIFDRALYFKKNDLYNRKNHNLTLNRLVNLGTFKFVKNQFKESDTTGNYLDAYYYLTPLPKKSIRTEILAKTNSANYSGTELNVNWSNRNTFKGAELLTISAFGGLEVQVTGINKGFNVYRVGAESSLIWPRFISPLKIKSSSGFVPKTKATIGYEYQNRAKLYSLNSFKGSFGYLWKENIRKEHQLNVVDITFVSPTNVTDLYRQKIVEDQTGGLAKVIEKQLIFGTTYSYTYTNTMETARKHTIYFKGAADFAGNAAGLITGADVTKKDPVTVFNVPFSQYSKMEVEFRHYLKLSERTQLASRVIVGASFPYGNSAEMPFIKQFFIGGTNSLRAFRARSIGPGTFRSDASSFLPDQSGDIKFEINTELRAKLYSVVHGAVFIDAGNIWLINKDNNKPGSQFTSDFLNELAVGTGVGLRFDFSFLLLRTDLAFPLRKPYLPDGNRWVLDQIDFGSSTWRKENLVFNLAIGYPF